MFKNKHTIMGPEMRFEVLYDLLSRYISCTHCYYIEFPTETRYRLDRAFKRLIKSIIDIDEMELLSIGKIFFKGILPFAKHAIRIEEGKLCKSKKNQEDKCKDTTDDAESQTEEKQEPEQKEKDGECHFSIEIPEDLPEEDLRKLLGEYALQKVGEICKIHLYYRYR